MTKIAIILLTLNGGPAHSLVVGKHFAWDHHRTTVQAEFAKGVYGEWVREIEEEDREGGCEKGCD